MGLSAGGSAMVQQWSLVVDSEAVRAEPTVVVCVSDEQRPGLEHVTVDIFAKVVEKITQWKLTLGALFIINGK